MAPVLEFPLNVGQIDDVQELKKSQKNKIPNRFVRDLSERPMLPITPLPFSSSIPIIDLTKLMKGNKEECHSEILKLSASCEEWGFFQMTSSNNIRRRQAEATPGWFLKMEQYGMFINIGVMVVTQMSDSSEELKNFSLWLLGAIFAVYAIEFWVMPYCNGKWKVTIFRIASGSTKLLSIYLLPCILKPKWLTWYGIVIVCIIATALTCSDDPNVMSHASTLYQDIKTKFKWCCEKVVLVINYVIDKVSKPRKDQASPASAPPRASV